MLCHWIKAPWDQIKLEAVTEGFRKYRILNSVGGDEEDFSSKKKLRIVKTLEVEKLKMVNRVMVMEMLKRCQKKKLNCSSNKP